MCVQRYVSGPSDLKAVKASAKGGRVVGWKVLTRAGRSDMFSPASTIKINDHDPGYPYHPGWTMAQRGSAPIPRGFAEADYFCKSAGLHVFREGKGGNWAEPHQKRVRVAVLTEDIIAADERQFAVRKLYIAPKDWKAAGLPDRPTKRKPR